LKNDLGNVAIIDAPYAENVFKSVHFLENCNRSSESGLYIRGGSCSGEIRTAGANRHFNPSTQTIILPDRTVWRRFNMTGRVRSPRRRAFLPACNRLESRELLNGTMELLHPTGMPAAMVAATPSVRPHKLKGPIITRLNPNPDASFSTVPPNGDVNPYGVAFVPSGFPGGGLVHAGDILVSNFNNSSNAQGTGTTIVDISPSGSQSVFFQDPNVPGLTTTLGVLQRGFVLVGNTPTNGNLVPTGIGSLLILDRHGNVVDTLSSQTLLNGPWGLTVNDLGAKAQVFVSNVFSGTVTRIDLKIPKHGDKVQVQDMVQIASGYAHQANAAAFQVGPTGLAYNPTTKVLYVASTDDNAIFAIRNASKTRSDNGMGSLVYQDQAHLRGPLGLALAPNGDLLTTNGDAINADPTNASDSELIEFTPTGTFVGQLSLDPGVQGAAFGLAISTGKRRLELATVNDGTNAVDERFLSF
jgi:DNA-binding beta-propeller fold protein YncE